MLFFFFKQKTAYEISSRDWSSDVCSSDLPATPSRSCRRAGPRPRPAALDRARGADGDPLAAAPLPLPVRTTTPAAIVSGEESASPERDDRISSCPQAAATGSR